MAPETDRALATRRALERAAAGRPDRVAEAEARLAAALAEVTALDLVVEALSLALGEFSRRYEQALSGAFADLDAAERLVRRLQALEDEAARLMELLRNPPRAPARPARRKRRRTGRPEEAEAPAEPSAALPDLEQAEPAEIEPEELVLKRLFRRLARILHPDLAQDDAERARLGELMARVNAAYAKRDRTALELMAEKVGAGEPLGVLSEEERLVNLEKRTEALVRIAESLRRERDRLAGTRTRRLHEEAERRGIEGRDFLEESRAEVLEEAAHAVADALSRMDRLSRSARDLEKLRSTAMSSLTRHKGPTGALRAFDPLSESALVRRGALHLERQRATREARELARHLEEAAERAPWEAALTLLAFFAEAAGRPPASLERPEGWAERYQHLCAGFPEAPSFERLLTRLPRHLEVGMRAGPQAVAAGVQLASADLAAGVRIALTRAGFARLGREVLLGLGPRERCRSCRRTALAVHLMRTRGLDELNGLVCPKCGEVLRSYWRYGEVEGLEALAPYALQLAAVAEQVVRLAGAAIGFQMLPAERQRLTAGQLRDRLLELYFTPYGLELAPSQVALQVGGRALASGAPVPERGAVKVALGARAVVTEAEALELLRSRIERRFRPAGSDGS
jgi:hypothetical protein